MSVRGACPTLWQPMPTGDGLLVRLATRDRALTPPAARRFATLAARDGNGRLEITARGHWQVRGLRPDTTARFAADVSACLEAVDTRLVVGPLAGLDPSQHADPRPLATALAETLSDVSASPKLSIVVDGGGAVSLDEVAADLRLRAIAPALWRFEVAGTTVASGLGEAIAAQACAALRQLAAGLLVSGSRGGTATPPTPPDKREGGHRQRSQLDQRGSLCPAPSRLSGGVRGGALPLGSMPPPRDAFASIPLRNGSVAFGITAPFGALTAPELTALAILAEHAGASSLRLAPGRIVLIVGVEPDAAATLCDALAATGWITAADDPRLSVAACPGSEGCASGLIPARAIATALNEALGGRVSLHVSGCPKGCAHPQPAALTVVGHRDGYAVVRNGRAGDTPLGVVAHQQMASWIARQRAAGG